LPPQSRGFGRTSPRLPLPNAAYITNIYDPLGGWESAALRNSTNGLLNFRGYQYDAAHERSRQTFTASNYVGYVYDPLGQLISAKGKESDSTARLQEQLSYGYDAARNLSYRTNNGLVQSFAVNGLNQLTNVSRARSLTVAGTTTSAATNVTVNSYTAARYGDNTFAREGFNGSSKEFVG
jgi:YD repeat-containing protein